MSHRTRTVRSRRGAILLLSALLVVVIVGMVAMAVDVGYMFLVRTQFQAAADSAALAAAATMANPDAAIDNAKEFAAYHNAGGDHAAVTVEDRDVEFGVWDTANRTFSPSADQAGNAVRVTVRGTSKGRENGLFFGRIFGRGAFETSASAVAMGNPRDICLVVDLSGSMNNDTEPGYTGNGTLSGAYAAIRTQMMQKLFSDFSFGAYPGTQQAVGGPLGVTNYSALIASSGPLTKNSVTYQGKTYTIGSQYKIKSNDSTATKQQKAYKWMIDYQIAAIMPAAKPPADSNSTSSYNYWAKYLDQITGQSSSNQTIGYRTYVQFMMDNGREVKPDGSNFTPLSKSSPDCPYHSESVGAGTFSFPPREEPTHSCRRSLIAAIQEIADRNSPILNPDQRDWVSIVSFDTVAGTALQYPLSGDYGAAMQACTKLQATSDVTSTATETGLIAAYNHIKPKSEGGFGRKDTQKVVVLLTDGMPNLKSSSDSAIANYIKKNPNADFYDSSSSRPEDAALMQADTVRGKHWDLFAVGVGLDADNGFMDRMARMGGTANDKGQAPRTTGDPAEYENELRTIFKQIVDAPTVRLVQ